MEVSNIPDPVLDWQSSVYLSAQESRVSSKTQNAERSAVSATTGLSAQNQDRAEISEAGRAAAANNEKKQGKSSSSDESSQSKTDSSGLSEEEVRRVEYLKSRDRQVRSHEQAHVMAGGGLVRGGASFGYETGPDGKKYAVSGEVSIDTSTSSDDPEATLQKAQQIQRAALAPADPSGQDRKVAAEAASMAAEARAEIARQQFEKLFQTSSSSQSNSTRQIYA